MQHFFLNQDLSGHRVTVTNRELIHQLQEVLRLKKGNAVMLLDGKGIKAKAVIEELHKKAAIFELSQRELCPLPSRQVHLYCALSKKPSTFELIVQKATELGATAITPLITDRCQIQELRKMDRLRLIIQEAAEQCERFFLPKLNEPISFFELLSKPPTGLLLAGDPWDIDKKLSEISGLSKENVNLIIGPEGGLTESELDTIRKVGGTIFLLGNTVLRMETAAIAALSVVQFG